MRHCFTVLFFCTVKLCFAQDHYYRHFGVEEGLPGSEVYDVHQDKHGLIWMATDRGVSRYDGYDFRNFSTAEGLTDNTVFLLEEDIKGNIWCGTFNNRLCYFTGDSITQYAFNAAIANEAGSYCVMQSLNVTGNGEVIVGYQRNGCMLIDRTGNLDVMRQSSGKSEVRHEVYCNTSYTVFGSHADPSTSFPLLNDRLHVYFDDKTIEILLPHPTGIHYITGIRSMNGMLLIATDNMLIEIAPDFSYKVHVFPSQVIRINEDTEGNIWVSLQGAGARQYSPGSDFSSDMYRTFLPGETVTDVCQDHEGGYWFSTLGHGVYYLTSSRVHCLFLTSGNGKMSVTALASDKSGNIFLGTSIGLVYTYNDGKIKSNVNLNTGNDSTAFVQDIYVSSSTGEKWMCTNQAVFYALGTEPEQVLSSGIARTSCGDGSGGAWFAGTARLFHFGKDDPSSAIETIPLEGRVEDIFYDTVSGQLLVGRVDGLFTLHNDQLNNYNVPGEPITTRVSSVVRSDANTIAVGTIGEGIITIRNGRRINMKPEDGLCSPVINDLATDSGGNIWAATNGGVARIMWSADTFLISCFSVFHGLPTNEVRRILCVGDTIWIGTNEGAAWFIPLELERNPIAPPVFIRGVFNGGTEQNLSDAHVFPYNENHIRISFLGISYRNASNTLYRYRLSGLSSDWIYTTNTSVEYASLPPGEYFFEVMARNGDGTWSLHPASCAFSITPPVWMQWWFWLIVITGLITAVWWLIRRRLANIRRNAQQKALLAEYQHQALAAQMNPHFIFNSLTSMQAFVLYDEKENALRYIDRFSFLMRRSLEHSMQKFVPLEKEVELLRAYLDIESMRFEDKFIFTIDCEPSLSNTKVDVPAMVVQPFVENAVRHGLLHREEPAGYVHVRFELTSDLLWCTVEDNGVGRNESARINRSRKKHNSYGSSVTEARLRLLCDATGVKFSLDYTDKSSGQNGSSPAGTIVRFVLPFQKRKTDDTRTTD